MDTKTIWGNLSAEAQQQLEWIVEDGGEATRISDKDWQELERMKLVQFTDFFVRLTTLGLATFAAKPAPQSESTTPATDELDALRQQLATVTRERDGLRAAMREALDKLQIVGNTDDGLVGGGAGFAALLDTFKILRTALGHKHTADGN